MLKVLIALAMVHACIFADGLQTPYTDKDVEVYTKENARIFEKELKTGKLLSLVKRASDRLVAHTVKTLAENGHAKEAQEIQVEWALYNQAFFVNVGDYAGIAFLVKVHDKAHELLGEELCKATRVHDLFYLAYCLPMILDCSGLTQIEIDSVEYSKHFIPFCGVVAYWVTYGACTAATGIPFVCGLPAMGVERLVIKFVAPKFTDRIYPKSCKRP